jgi:hypothetical protein
LLYCDEARVQNGIHNIKCRYKFIPEVVSLVAFFAMSSATKDVATLRRGILNSFDILLKIITATPAEPNSTGPKKERAGKRLNRSVIRDEEPGKHKYIKKAINARADQYLICQ